MTFTYRKIAPPSHLGGEPTAYEVTHDGVVIGTVVSDRRTSWRKSGRIRTSVRGRPREWGYGLPGQVASGFFFQQRGDAAEALLNAFEREAIPKPPKPARRGESTREFMQRTDPTGFQNCRDAGRL